MTTFRIIGTDGEIFDRFKATGAGTSADPKVPDMSLAPRAASMGNTHEPAANNAAMITLGAPGPGVHHVIAGLYWSYDGAPTGGSLVATDGGNQVFKVDVTDSGPGFLPFTPPMRFTDNAAVVITLAAGGAGVSGIVNVHAWTE